MYAKDKKLLERGYKCLTDKLGEEKSGEFISLLFRENMQYDALKELCDSLEAERQKKAEAAKPVKKELRPVSEAEFAVIKKEYGNYLKELGISYQNNQGFSLWLSKDKTKWDIHISLRRGYFSGGGISLDSYIGRALTGKVHPVNQLEKMLTTTFPECRVYTETFHKYAHEFSLIKEVEYTTIEDLHREVVNLIDISEKAIEIGKEKFGSNFEN